MSVRVNLLYLFGRCVFTVPSAIETLSMLCLQVGVLVLQHDAPAIFASG